MKITLNEKGLISGKDAFIWRTTFGLGLERLEELAGAKIDMEEYDKLFLEHRKISARSCLKKFGHKSKLLQKE